MLTGYCFAKEPGKTTECKSATRRKHLFTLAQIGTHVPWEFTFPYNSPVCNTQPRSIFCPFVLMSKALFNNQFATPQTTTNNSVKKLFINNKIINFATNVHKSVNTIAKAKREAANLQATSQQLIVFTFQF